MSAATKCDRCGKFFDHRDEQGNKVKRIRIELDDISSNVGGKSKYYDLCPGCAELLDIWLKGNGEVY